MSYICSNVLWETVSNENNTYLGLTTTDLSRRLIMHLNDSSSIALHLNTHSIPKSKFRKIIVENTSIIEHQITPNQAETLLHSLERAAAGIDLHVNAHKTEYMCYNQTGNITTLDGASLRLVDKFTYLGSSVSSTENDIDTRLTKAWTAIDRLSIIWKSDLTDEMKRSFFQAIDTAIWMHYMDANQTAGEETWRQLHKNVESNIEQVLATTPHDTPIVRPPASHHENYTGQTSQTRQTLLEKQRQARKWCTTMDPHIWPSKSRTTSPNLHTAAMWGHRM